MKKLCINKYTNNNLQNKIIYIFYKNIIIYSIVYK